MAAEQSDVSAQLQLSVALLAAQAAYQQRLESTTQITVTPSPGKYDMDGRSYPGDFYHIKANQGTLAIRVTHMNTTEPGTMDVGIRFPTRFILTMLKLHKTRHEDFVVARASGLGEPVETHLGVIDTISDPQYLQHPVATLTNNGRIGLDRFYNCEENDVWLKEDKPMIGVRNPTTRRS